MDKLTQHFTFDEFTRTDRELLQAENRLQAEPYRNNMVKVCNELEKLRAFVFRPIFITSGFRYLALNKVVGSSITSQHLTGSAADFTVKDFSDASGLGFLFSWCCEHLDYGQLILENPLGRSPWIHIGLPREGRERTRYVFENGVYRKM